MAGARLHWAPGVLWALLLFQLLALTLAQSVPTVTTALECACENFTPGTATLKFSNGSSSVCPCACGKTTWIPTTHTEVYTLYDSTTSDGSIVTAPSATLSDSSALSSFFSSFASSVRNFTTSINGTGIVSSSWTHLFPGHNVTSVQHTTTASGIFWTGPGSGIGGTFISQTVIWKNSTTSSLLSTTRTSSIPIWINSTMTTLRSGGHLSSNTSAPSRSTMSTLNSGGFQSANTSVPLSVPKSSIRSKPSVSPSSVIDLGTTTPAPVSTTAPPASPIASSTLPSQTISSVPTTGSEKTSSKASAASTNSQPTETSNPALVPPFGTITVEPLAGKKTDGSLKTTSVTWLSIDVPTRTTINGDVITTSFPAWRCISLDLCNPDCLVPDEICLPAPSANPLGYPWPEKPEKPPSSVNGVTLPGQTSTKGVAMPGDPGQGGGGGGDDDDDGDHGGDDDDDHGGDDDDDDGGDDDDHGGDDDDGGDDDHGGDDDDDGGDDDDDGGDDDHDGDDDDHGGDEGHGSDDDGRGHTSDDDDEKSLFDFRIDLGLDIIDKACNILGHGMDIGFGTNKPAGKTEPDEPEPSQSKKETTTSTSTSSCTQTYTIAPHCTQPCVVSQIRSQGTSSFTTSCATATCRTTQLCTSIETTTTTTYTTKKPKPTAGCMVGKCLSCQDDNNKLEARQGWWDEDILTETISEPEEWHEGEYEWWEKMRRVAKYYGPGLAMGSKTGHDSSASWEAFGPTPHGGGAGPVWGCTIIASFSPEGVYANHLWEIPNFNIPPDQEKYFAVEKGYREPYYFEQNINRFLQYGSLDTPKQKEYPALCPMNLPGGPLYGDNYQFFRTIMFVPIETTGKMYYAHQNSLIMSILTEKCKIDKKYITIYGYEPKEVLDKDFQYDLGRATPPADRRASNPWDGLFSWQYTPKGASGQKELVVRFEKSIIHRDAWCGDGLVTQPEAPVRFDLRPSPPRDPNQDTTRPSANDSPPPSDDEDTSRPSDTGTPRPPAKKLKIRQDEGTCPRMIACGLGSPKLSVCDYKKFPPPPLEGPSRLKSRAPPSNDPAKGPIQAEIDLETDIMIEPKDSIGGERWWYTRMRHVVDERGPGYGGVTNVPKIWSTSAMVRFNQEVDGTYTDRPRFGGSGPVWGCTVVIVASPAGVWTSHIWEIPTLSLGAEFGSGDTTEWARIYPRSQIEYFGEGVVDFLSWGNNRGSYRQLKQGKVPTRNPGFVEFAAKNSGEPFDVKTKTWLWAGIITRAHRDMRGPSLQYQDSAMRTAYSWQVEQIQNILKQKLGIHDRDFAKIFTYAPRPNMAQNNPGMPPESGLVSWQYHPSHVEEGTTHSERKLRIRFEKHVIFEKTWCGSGNKVIIADGSTEPPPPPAPAKHRRQEDEGGEVEACLLAHNSSSAAASASSVAASAASVLPRPTQACTADAECGSLSCPQPRFGACLYGACRCVLSESLSYTKTPATPVPGMYTNTVLPVNYTSPTNLITLSPGFSTSSISSNSSTSKTSWTGDNDWLFPTATKNGSSSTGSAMFTVTLSAWDPSQTSIIGCNTTQDCSSLSCGSNQTYACITKGANPKPTCRCVNRPKLFEPCAAPADCEHLKCDANHFSACRPLIDFPGAYSICLCEALALKPGAFCTVDSHCDGLPCDGTKNRRGKCLKPTSDDTGGVGLSGGCQCGYYQSEGVGCASHDDCSTIRCFEDKPYKSCTIPDGPLDKEANFCACAAEKPPRRLAEGDKCAAHKECATIGCTEYEVSVCEKDTCRCRSFMCSGSRDCDSSALDCAGKGNLLCGEKGMCECKPCTENWKGLTCLVDADCNHCCKRGTLPKCKFTRLEFWSGNECQCDLWN